MQTSPSNRKHLSARHMALSAPSVRETAVCKAVPGMWVALAGWQAGVDTLAQEGVVLPRDCFSSCMYSSSRSSGRLIPCTA